MCSARRAPKRGKAKDEAKPLHLTDPRTGETIQIADVRAEFERLSRQTTRSPEAHRAFLENKMDLIRSDPHLTNVQKQEAIDYLKRGLNPR